VGNIRVLLIEDNDDDVLLIKDSSKELVMTDIIRAGKLEDGISHSRKDKFDVVLLDLDLPDSCGIGTQEAKFRFRMSRWWFYQSQ
jgi:DNA-binding response OmpR family regulator